MKLSVIIPVYNGADFIQKSYDSIIGQSIDDFEILYIDNNSTDTSVDRIKTLVAIDHRVKLLSQSRQGASAARNLGIENAHGDYVYVFDVDDEIYPKALLKMIEVLETHNELDAVFGKMVKSYQGIDDTDKPEDESDSVVIKEKPYWGLTWLSELKEVVGPPAFLYRRQVFSKIGTYNEDIRIGEDTAFDIKLGMTCNVAFLDTYIYLYFKHEQSTIQFAKKNDDKIAMHWNRFVKSHLPFYLENDVPLRYKKIVCRYLFVTIGKLIFVSKSYKERNALLENLLIEIEPLKMPFLLRIYLKILVIFPISFALKFYVYYLVPYYIRNRINYF